MKMLRSILVFILMAISVLIGPGKVLAAESLTIPDTPKNLVATPSSPTVVHLTWDDVSNEDQYIVYVKINNAWTVFDTTAADSCAYSHKKLNPNTNYCYAVASSNKGTTSMLSNFACASTFVGIKDQTKNELNCRLYPNPVRDILIFEYRESDEVFKVSLYDVNGCLVYSKNASCNKTVIDLSLLQNGIYFLNIFGNDISINEKLIKE